MTAKLPIKFRWREMSITVKFMLAFSALLALIVVIAVIGYIALTLVRPGASYLPIVDPNRPSLWPWRIVLRGNGSSRVAAMAFL